MDSNLPKDSCMLTPKEEVGLDLEVRTQLGLKTLAIPFSGNPTDPSAWKRAGCGNNKPKQHRPDIETQTLQIECKFVGHAFYPSYLKENVYPRFKDNGKTKVVITNNKDLWSQEAIEELAKNNIKLWTHADLKDYFRNPTFTSIYNNINSEYESCTSVVKHFTVDSKTTMLNLIRNTLNSILKAVFETKILLLNNPFAQKKNDTLNPKQNRARKTIPMISATLLQVLNFLENRHRQVLQIVLEA